MIPVSAHAVVTPWPAPPVDSISAPRERLLWYPTVARWAPSKHNTQPWRFVVRPDSLDLWADQSRALLVSDPTGRELLLSCGAALHHLEVAARALGRRLSVTLLPEGGTNLVARVEEDGSVDVKAHDLALLAAVAKRRTDRGPLDRAPLSLALPFQLQSAAAAYGVLFRLVASAGDRATLADLVERGDRVLVREGHAEAELSAWLRDPRLPGADGVPRDRTRGAAASYRAAFVQRDFSGSPGAAPVKATHDRTGRDHPILGVLCTTEDRPLDWVNAGRALSAVLLESTTAGANASFLNQPVELPALRAEMRTALSLGGEAQVVLRIGRGGAVAPTARRPIEDLRTHVG